MINIIFKKYMFYSFSYGLCRGIYYNYNRNDICNNDKVFNILATGLINPAYIGYSLTHDYNNLSLYYNHQKIIDKDWWYGCMDANFKKK